MPELPEVTTMVKGLRKTVLKSAVLDIWCDSKKNIKKPSFKNFKKGILKARIEKIERKGKLILFYLSNNKVLIIHPKMTGHFLYGFWEKAEDKWIPKSKKALSDPMNRFIHLMFFMDNGKMLAFSDLRKFARIELWDKKNLEKADILEHIGPDALKVSLKDFKEIIKKAKKRKIKQVLMEQGLIAGIGNIYSDEILFRAGVNPFRTADTLKSGEVDNIYSAIKFVLDKAVELAGSSISDFRKVDGKKGGFQEIIKVYHRQGKQCFRCKGIVIKKKLGGRSTHFCPECQK